MCEFIFPRFYCMLLYTWSWLFCEKSKNTVWILNEFNEYTYDAKCLFRCCFWTIFQTEIFHCPMYRPVKIRINHRFINKFRFIESSICIEKRLSDHQFQLNPIDNYHIKISFSIWQSYTILCRFHSIRMYFLTIWHNSHIFL